MNPQGLVGRAALVAGRRWRWALVLAAWGALCLVSAPQLLRGAGLHAAREGRPRRLLQSAPTPPPPPLSTPHAPAGSARLALDASTPLTEQQLRAEAERTHPSLPLSYWHASQASKNKFYRSKDCAPLPSVYDIQWDNTYWQKMVSSNGTFHLYGAYLDVRNTSRIGPAVRVLSLHDRLRPTLTTHCQLWFEGRDEPAIVRTLEYKYMWNSKWGNYKDGVMQPYLLACVLPQELRALAPRLAVVSLVEKPCDRASNALRVHYHPPPPGEARKEFAVCVKGLDFLHEDLSVRLVEWVELVTLLGADKVFFYQLQIHPNMSKVLEHYERMGLATVTPITLPGGQPNLPHLQHMYLKKKTTNKRQNELIPYNDCLYQHMYQYRWLVLLDIDEVIVPLLDGGWSALMARVQADAGPAPAGKVARSSYHASNVYYLDELQHAHGWQEGAPRYLHMLQHVWRTRNFTKPGQYVKAFHETDRVLALHNHFPLACVSGPCSSLAIRTELARLQHYRADCVTALSASCAQLRKDSVRDPAIWRWKDELVARADRTLGALGFLRDDTAAR